MSNEASYVPDNGAKADIAVHGPDGMKCLAWRLLWNPHSFPDFGMHKILKRRVIAKGKRKLLDSSRTTEYFPLHS